MDAKHNAEIIVGIRPEDLEDAALATSHPLSQRLTAQVVLTESLGSDHMVHFAIDAAVAKVADQDSLDEIVVSDNDKGICIGRFDACTRVQTGETVAVAVTCDRMHFFDDSTGIAL